MVFSDRIRLRREMLKLSQAELAEAIGTSQKQVSRYERGENIPSAEVVVDIARTLSTTTDYLLGLTERVSRPVVSDDDLDAIERQIIEAWRLHDYKAAIKLILEN